MKRGTLLHRIWWETSDRGDTLWAMWRPVCWVRGYHVPHHCDVYFELCTWCGKRLWSRSKYGGKNPYYYSNGRPMPKAPLGTRWLKSESSNDKSQSDD